MNTKKKEQKNEIYQDENIELFKIKYRTVSILMKLFSLFDLKKSNFYSLNIKSTKELESFFKSLQQVLINNNINCYMSMIFILLQQYIFNMDLFYELDNSLYEKIFNLLLMLIEKSPFNDESNNNINIEKNKFIENLKLNELSLTSDDSVSKYIMILMKLFKFFTMDNNKGEYNTNYIKYFQKVLNFAFEITQGYLKDKYISLLQRELKTKIENNDNIIKILFNEILDIIKQIIETKDITFIKNYKNISKFFGNFEVFLDEIISYINNNFNKEEISQNDEIIIILLLSMFNNNKKMTKKFIEEVPCKIILFINQNMINYHMNNFIENEINCLNNVIKEYFNNKKEECQKAIIDKFYNKLKNDNIYDVIELWDLVISQKINLDIKNINSLKNENNYKIIDGIILYSIINGMQIDEIQELYKCDRDFIKEIQDVNDTNGHFKGSGYISNNKNLNILNLIKRRKKLKKKKKKKMKKKRKIISIVKTKKMEIKKKKIKKKRKKKK